FVAIDGQALPAQGIAAAGWWSIYNMFYRQIEVRGIGSRDMIAKPTPMPSHLAEPPLTPQRSVWREMVEESRAQYDQPKAAATRIPVVDELTAD
ncbi:MAG: hypothetical protein HC826_02795, partial [Rhodospirillales bacterium]|nr:hypothetical protein [Rhodospirillales bacterium]